MKRRESQCYASALVQIRKVTQSQDTVLCLLEIHYSKLTVVEQDILFLPVMTFLQKNIKIDDVLCECPSCFRYGAIWCCITHEIVPSGYESRATRDHSLKAEGAILITGLEGFNPVNLFPGTLTPIFTITTHSDGSNCEN